MVCFVFSEKLNTAIFIVLNYNKPVLILEHKTAVWNKIPLQKCSDKYC